MKPFSWMTLRDRTGDDSEGGGGGVGRGRSSQGSEPSIDDLVPDPRAAKKEEKAAKPDPRDVEIESLRKRLSETESSERHWAEEARKQRARPHVDDDAPEPQAEPEPDKRVSEHADLTPEQFLDVLSKEGLKGLKRFGFLTEADVDERVKEIERRVEGQIDNRARQFAFDQRLASEFPGLVLNGAKEPKDPALFAATAKIFNEMVADDPALKNSPGTLLAAARMATKEIHMETERKKSDDKQKERRDRIEGQRGSDDRGGSHEDDNKPQMSQQQRSIVSELARFGATEEGFERISRGGKGRG